MHIDDFERFFDNHILERGRTYYLEGRVHDFKSDYNVIEAFVEGDLSYHVVIRHKSSQMTQLLCDCPYAKEGHRCKHEAALLYAYREIHRQQAYEEKQKNIKQILHHQSREAVEGFLEDFLLQDQRFYEAFCERFVHQPSREEVRQVRLTLNRLLERYRDLPKARRHDLAEDLYHFLRKDLNPLIHGHYQDEAFSLMCMIFDDMQNDPLPDHKYRRLVEDELIHSLKAIIEEADGLLEKRIFDYLQVHRQGWLGDDLEAVLFAYFPDFQKQKLTYLNEQIESSMNDQSRIEKANTLADYALTLDLDENEIQAFCERFFSLPVVEAYYYSYCLDHHQENRLRHLLEKYLEDTRTNRDACHYALLLKDLYQGNDQTRYDELLWQILTVYDPCRTDIYHEYKKLHQNDWEDRLNLLLHALDGQRGIDVIYYEEGMYDELADYVCHHYSSSLVESYGHILKDYPDIMLRLYEDRIEALSQDVSDRATYRQISYLLRQMKKFAGGSEQMERLLHRLKNTYRNRPAMMDELNKV